MEIRDQQINSSVASSRKSSVIDPLEIPPPYDPPDLGDIQVSLSAGKLQEDSQKARQSMELFVQTKFDDAEEILRVQENYPASLYLNMAMGFILFTKSMFTFTPEDVEKAIDQMELVLKMAKKAKGALSKPCLATRLYNIFSRSGFSENPIDEHTGQQLSQEDSEFVYAQAELIEAEASVLLSVLNIVGEPDGMNYMVLLREVWNVRRGYIFFRQHSVLEDGKVSRLKSDKLMNDEDYRSAILLGNGCINVMFSMMPPSIFKVFAVIGYTGDRETGEAELKACGETNTARGMIARIFLLLNYSLMQGALTSSNSESASTADRAQLIHETLDPILKKYPHSPIILFNQGRAHFLQREVQQALNSYHLALKYTEQAWPALTQVIHWDLFLGYMRLLDFDECLKYAILLSAESTWSMVFCMYLEIVLRTAVSRQSEDDSLKEPILEMFKVLPQHEKRIAGRAFPMERFAITRGEMILQGKCRLDYPEFELMTLWDSYSYMDEATLERAESIVREGLNGDLPEKSRALLQVSLAAILRTKGTELETAHALLKSIEKDPPEIDCKCHTHLLPLTHVELAATLIKLGQLKEARVHYNSASKWKVKHYLDRTIQVRCSKLAGAFKRKL